MKTVRATVLFAISDDGYWIVEGHSDIKSQKKRRAALDEQITSIGILPPVKYYEVSVDLPVPPPERAVKLQPAKRRAR